jgi:hypothetical protein
MSGNDSNGSWVGQRPFDMSVQYYGCPSDPTVPNPWEPVSPMVPWTVPSTTITTITLKAIDDAKAGRVRDIAHEMRGAAESLIAQGKKRVGQLMMKYAARIIEELEDNE